MLQRNVTDEAHSATNGIANTQTIEFSKNKPTKKNGGTETDLTEQSKDKPTLNFKQATNK